MTTSLFHPSPQCGDVLLMGLDRCRYLVFFEDAISEPFHVDAERHGRQPTSDVTEYALVDESCIQRHILVSGALYSIGTWYSVCAFTYLAVLQVSLPE